MRMRGYKNYSVSEDGEYIFNVENKLIYTDGDYDYPQISKVLTFNTNNQTEFEIVRRLLRDTENTGIRLNESIEIINAVYGQEFIGTADFRDSSTFEELQNKHGEGVISEKADRRGGKNKRRLSLQNRGQTGTYIFCQLCI